MTFAELYRTESTYHDAVVGKAATLYHGGRVIPCRVTDTTVGDRGTDYVAVAPLLERDCDVVGDWFKLSELGPPLDPAPCHASLV